MVQLVARDLAKVELAGSSPVYRLRDIERCLFFLSWFLQRKYVADPTGSENVLILGLVFGG